MMTSDRTRHTGFTLIEIVVVLGVLGILLGAAVPLVTVFVDQQRAEEVRGELSRLATALDAYYHDHAQFPPSLDDAGFLGRYLAPGLDNTAIHDGWGGHAEYVYAQTTSPDVATITSRGENGRYERGQGDDLRMAVPGAPAGNARTRSRIRMISAALAEFVQAGGKLTGSFKADLRRLGLGAPYDLDGFGTGFRIHVRTLGVQSAGADRRFGTKDDLTS